MNSNIDTRGLLHNPIIYVENALHASLLKWKFFRFIHIVANILIIIAGFVTLVFSTILVSRLIWESFPVWYYLLVAGISAATTFVSSLLNFFVVKKKMERGKTEYDRIKGEILHFYLKTGKYSKKNKKYILFSNVAAIKGVEYAEEEVENE